MDIEVLENFDVPYEVLDQEGILNIEPGLYVYRMTGDCFIFTTKLAELAANMGVEFKYNQTINQILVRGQSIVGVDLTILLRRYTCTF